MYDKALDNPRLYSQLCAVLPIMLPAVEDPGALLVCTCMGQRQETSLSYTQLAPYS